MGVPLLIQEAKAMVSAPCSTRERARSTAFFPGQLLDQADHLAGEGPRPGAGRQGAEQRRQHPTDPKPAHRAPLPRPERAVFSQSISPAGRWQGAANILPSFYTTALEEAGERR